MGIHEKYFKNQVFIRFVLSLHGISVCKMINCNIVLFFLFSCCFEFQISGILKDNEKIQSNPEVPPSDDDTELKKIKKVKLKSTAACTSCVHVKHVNFLC